MADLPLPVGSDEERPQSDAALWATHEAMRLGEMLDGGIDNWEEKERRLMSNPEVQATHLQWAQEFPEVEEDELEAPPGIPSPAPPPPSGPPPDEEDDDDHDDLVMSQDAPDIPPPPPGVPSLSLDDLSAHEDDDEHYHDDDEHELDENYTDRTNEEYTSRTDEDYTSRTNEEYSEDAASESDYASASDEEMQPTRSVSDPLLGESKPSPSPGRRRGRSRTRRRRRRHSASADSRSRSVSKSQARGRSLSTSTPADKQITPRSAKTRPRRLKKRQLKRIQTARRAPRRPKAKSLSTTDKPKRPKSDRSSKRKGRRRVNRKRLEELSQPKSQPVLRERWTRRAASSADISKPTKRKPKSRRSKRSSMPDISAPAPDGSQSPPTESRSRKGSDASDRPRWNHSVRPRPIERVGSILSKDGSMLPTSPSSKKRDFKPSPFAPGYVDEAYTADVGGDSGAPVVLEVGRGSLRVAGFGDLTKAAPGSHLVHEVVEEERTGEDSSTSDGEPDADPAGASTLTEDSEALLEEAGALKVRDIKPSPMTKEALRDSESDRIDSAGAEYVQELVTRLRRALLESNGLLLESEKDRVSLAVINSRLQVHVAELGSRHQKELELLQAKLQQRETQLIEAAQSHNVLKIRLAQAKGTVHDQMNTISFLETRLTALGEDGLSSDASLSTKEQLLRRQNEAMEQQLQEMTEYLEEMTGSMESTKQSTRKRDKQFEHKLLRREKKHASKLKRMQEHQENLQAAVAEYSEMLQLGDEEKAELLEQIRLLEAELHQREHEYENSRSSFTELQAAMQKETDELRERLAEWETKDAQFTRAESALQEEKAALLSKVEQLEVEAGKASQVDELQAQLHDLEAARAAVHAQHAQAAAQVAELHAKVAEAQEKHFRELEERAAVESELRAEHDRTEQNLAALTEQHRESETERERHRREAEQHRREAEQHRSEAEQHRAAAERHEAALRKVQQEAAMHEAALRQLEHEREELTSHASGKDSKYQESMREMRASMQATIDSLRATHREERAEYERLLDEVRATCDSQVQQIADLKRQERAPQPAAPVPDQAAADQELLAELLAAQRAQRAAEKKLSERDAQVEDMQDTIQMLEQSEKQLASGAALAREEMEKLEFDLTQAKRARNEDVKRVSALEIELKAKEQELSVSSKTLELALQRAEDAEKRSAALAMEVSSVKETKSELEAHLVLANTALGEPDVPEIAPVTPDHIQRGACTNDRGQCDPCVIS